MRETQGSYYERRAKFDGSFVNGKKFRYGTLFLGGKGLLNSKYGPFCTVFSLQAAEDWGSVAWLPENSLEQYVPEKIPLVVEFELLQRDIGAHRSRHHVTALKHSAEVVTRPPEEWPTMLCSGTCFVEGIVADELVPEQAERFLVDRDAWMTMLRANAAFIAGSATAEQQAKASQYRTLKSATRARNMTITWEQVR